MGSKASSSHGVNLRSRLFFCAAPLLYTTFPLCLGFAGNGGPGLTVLLPVLRHSARVEEMVIDVPTVYHREKATNVLHNTLFSLHLHLLLAFSLHTTDKNRQTQGTISGNIRHCRPNMTCQASQGRDHPSINLRFQTPHGTSIPTIAIRHHFHDLHSTNTSSI